MFAIRSYCNCAQIRHQYSNPGKYLADPEIKCTQEFPVKYKKHYTHSHKIFLTKINIVNMEKNAQSRSTCLHNKSLELQLVTNLVDQKLLIYQQTFQHTSTTAPFITYRFQKMFLLFTEDSQLT